MKKMIGLVTAICVVMMFTVGPIGCSKEPEVEATPTPAPKAATPAPTPKTVEKAEPAKTTKDKKLGVAKKGTAKKKDKKLGFKKK